MVPLFKSHYSIGRSILTLEKKSKENKKTGPDSIIDLALENKLEEVFLVEDSISSFLEAYTNLKAEKLKLRFGLRISVCPDMMEKTEDSLNKQCKYVIFAKNNEGYKKLIDIYSTARTTGFYYEARIDFKYLNAIWKNEDLLLAIPFYDSFLFNNALTFSVCLPDFSVAKPIFFTEDNDLWFDPIVEKRVEEFAKNKYPIIKTKSIYYAKEKDFKAYLTFRCINNRSDLNKPNLGHFTSNQFSLESWSK